jgi:uncharacterized delta-60 repeat protein
VFPPTARLARLLGVAVLASAAWLGAIPEALAWPNLPAGIVGRTTRDGSLGCTSCHSSPSVSIAAAFVAPPASQIVGTSSAYQVQVSSSAAGANGLRMGMLVAAGGPGPGPSFTVLTGVLTPGSTQLVAAGSAGELAHNSSVAALATLNSNGLGSFVNSYSFNFTMPAATTVGSTVTLHATSRVGIGQSGGGEANAPFISVIAAPVAPTSLTSPSKTSNSVTFNWAGSGPAYRLVRKAGASAPTSPTDGTTLDFNNVTTGTMLGLAAGTQYTFRIYSRSSSNNVFTPGPSLTVTTSPPAPVITSSLTTVNGTVGVAVPSYTITATDSPTSFGASNLPPGVTISGAIISGTPTGGGTFSVTLSATNAGGTGTATKIYSIARSSQSITFGTLPTPTFVSGGTFTVSAGASSGLAVTFSTASSSCFIQSQDGASATLQMQSAGTCTVFANQSGNSQFDPAPQVSASVTIAAVVPGAPTLASIQPGNGTASLSFAAPSSNGGSPITSYIASCTPGPVTGSGTASPVVVSGLANGTSYSCNVAAVNAAGTGPSSASLPVTPSLDQDGQLDPAFGTAGVSQPIFAGTNESARTVAIDAQNRILVGGQTTVGSTRQFGIARLLPDGALDTSFGTGGIAVVPTPGTESAVEGLAVDGKGRILVAGGSRDNTDPSTFVIARLTENGALDTSFAGTGVLLLPAVSKVQGVARVIAWDKSAGHVVAAGWDKEPSAAVRFVIVRVNEEGTLVERFGNNGIRKVPVGTDPAPDALPEGAATGLFIDSNGRTIVSGLAQNGASVDFAVLRVDDRGELDPGYGGSGIVTFDFTGGTDAAFMLIDGGKDSVLVSGYASSGTATGVDFAWVRFNNAGVPVLNVLQDQAGSVDFGTVIYQQPDGKVVVLGSRYGGAVNNFDFAMARFNADGTPDATFGAGGRTGVVRVGSDQVLAGRPQFAGSLVGVGLFDGKYSVMRFVIDAPAPFSFSPASVSVGSTTLVTSNAVSIGGLTSQAYVRVTGGEWARNCAGDAFTAAAGSIQPGETICVRHLSGATVGANVQTVLTVGGVSATFQSTVTFLDGPKPLQVTKAGSGAGTVTSNPAGIACGATCSASYPVNQVVVLVAAPAAGSTFLGWSGACSGTGACSVTMTAAKSVTATFDAPDPVRNDLSGDRRSDLVLQNADGRISAWLMNGTATTATTNLIGAGAGWRVIQVADLDADGKADIFFQHTDGRIYVYQMNGTTVIGGKELFPAGLGWTISHTTDLNNDGKADLLLRHTDGRAHMWLMSGTTIIGSATLLPAGSGWNIVGTGDLNGDGFNDLVFMNDDGRGYVYLMNGTTIIGGAGFLSPGSGWTVTHVADVNGDGKADLIFRHADGRAHLFLMNGTTFGAGLEILGAGTGWIVSHVGDMNGDGRSDFVFRHTDGRAHVRLMNGTTVVGASDILPAGAGWTVTHLLDFNADGKHDLVFRNVDGRITIRLMDGITTLGSANLLPAGGGWSAVP